MLLVIKVDRAANLKELWGRKMRTISLGTSWNANMGPDRDVSASGNFCKAGDIEGSVLSLFSSTLDFIRAQKLDATP